MAVTEGPGLIGALLVGLSAAKAIAFARGLPLVPVNHLHGHLASLYLQPEPVEPPFLALLASGGHTLILEVADHRGYRCIGGTLDDAAGEAFDKGARLLGLGYPGGAGLERLAAGGDPAAHAFPTGMLGRPGYDLSFSGLKTALRYALAGDAAVPRADLAASYQAAIVRALVERTAAAVADTGAATLAVVGGVARNGALRDAFAVRCRELGVRLALVAPELCSDNAAMIASAARYTDAIAYPAVPAPGRLRDRLVSVEVRVYSAAGCHLCEVAKALLEQERERARIRSGARWTSPATRSSRRPTASRSRSCSWQAARRSSTTSIRPSCGGAWPQPQRRAEASGADRREVEIGMATLESTVLQAPASKERPWNPIA